MSATPLVASSGASAALIALYLALGGATYKPLHVADPCRPRPIEQLRDRESTVERLALSSLDGAACRLRVTREELVLALATPESRAAFARTHHVGDKQIDAALRAGLERAVRDARRVGALSEIEAVLLGEAIKRVPVRLVIEALQTRQGESLLGRLTDLLRERAR